MFNSVILALMRFHLNIMLMVVVLLQRIKALPLDFGFLIDSPIEATMHDLPLW